MFNNWTVKFKVQSATSNCKEVSQQRGTERSGHHFRRHCCWNDNLRILEFQRWTTGGAFNHVKYGDRIQKSPLIDLIYSILQFNWISLTRRLSGAKLPCNIIWAIRLISYESYSYDSTMSYYKNDTRCQLRLDFRYWKALCWDYKLEFG